MKVNQFFHYISYLQYPFMLVALFYAFKPILGFDFASLELSDLLGGVNNMLVFMGLSVSFSSLQDTTKTQNEVSRKVWEDPKKGKIFIAMITTVTFICITVGLLGYFVLHDTGLRELSFGLTTFGVGLIGLLKAAIEMFENHRLDKNLPAAASSE